MADDNELTQELTPDELAMIDQMTNEYLERTTQGEKWWQLWPTYLAICPNNRARMLFRFMVGNH